MKTTALILLLALPLPAAAQGLFAPDGLSRADLGRPWVSAVTGYSDAEGLAKRSAGLSAGTPLGAIGGAKVSLNAAFHHNRILEDGWLPPELYDAGLQVAMRGEKNHLSAGIRSSSDRPFNSLDETDLSANFARTVSKNGPHSVTAGLAYSTRRSFARHIPFPYVAYNYNSEKFSFRLPFSVSWRPEQAWEFSAAYMPPKYGQVSASLKASPALTLKAEFVLSAAQYDLAGRADKKDSVFVEQPNAGLRTSYRASDGWAFSLYTGFTLGGRYYRGRTYDNYRDKVHLRGAPAVSLGLTRLFGLPFRPIK
ncbi:MAG: hypothetical protein PHV33_09475 [Elusimicrobiales bacterium]|nr:hypothetical protein [Elusimicrobiales bacterium]